MLWNSKVEEFISETRGEKVKGNEDTFREDNSVWFTSCDNGSTLKGKNLLPLWANSFLLEQFLFQKGSGVQESKQEVTTIAPLTEALPVSTHKLWYLF